MAIATDNAHHGAREDLALEYEQEGQGEALVLLHGLGGSAKDWHLQVPTLAQKYRVIAPSLRGFGHSRRPRGPMTIMQYADDVIELIDALGLTRVHVLGHSMGGAVALQLAVVYPERLHSLIVINAQASFAVRDWRRYLMVLVRLLAGGSAGMERLSRFVARQLFPGDHQRELRREMVSRYRRNDSEAYVAAIEALAGWSVEDRIDTVATPTLVVAGEHDITPVATARAFAERLPHGELSVVRDSGHATPYDQHETLNRLVLGFLATSSWGRNTPRTDRRRRPRHADAVHGAASDAAGRER